MTLPNGPCDVKVSRKGRKPCWCGDLVVGCMLGSKEFRWVMNCCVCSALWITNVSLTNLSQVLGGSGNELQDLVSKSSIRRLATTELRGDPMAAPFTCS